MSFRSAPVETLPNVGQWTSHGTAARTAWVAWFAHSRGWVSIAILTPAAVLAVFSPLRYHTDTWRHFSSECVAWLLFAAGAGVRWWSMLYIGGRKSWDLMTDGPYSMTRNPIYLGTLLLALSVAVLAQSLVFLLTLLAVAVGYFALAVLAEEQALLATHGDRFREYCRRVPRFLPSFRAFRTPATIEVNVSGMKSEFIRACRWVWIPLLCDLVTHLRCESWWPIWFTLP